ncbi:MAG: hypothetical protein ACR2PX_04230 [Endozoicomonas sp.]|uniref:hypothetical protein n=1 Tax=Endozoicomonas sp. TaxID=1892382 RepID=UPI003D9B1BC0
MLKRLFASRKRPYLVNGDNWEKIRIDLSGNILTMELPPHHNSYGFGGDTSTGEQKPSKQVNIYSPDDYWSDKIEEDEGMAWRREGYAVKPLLKKEWEFSGSIWRGRPLGSTTITMMLCHHETLPETMSYFNPEDLEKIAIRAAYFWALEATSFKQPRTPVNWRVINKPLAPWVFYEMHNGIQGDPENTTDFACIRCSLIIPIARDYCLRVYFRYSGYTPVSQSLFYMNRIRNQVIDSAHMEYSPGQKQHISELRKTYPNSAIREELKPMSWSFPEWRDGDSEAGEPSRVITIPGTRAPTL